MRFEPTPSGSKVYPHPSVKGVAYLCSPRREIFRMRLGGGMRRGIGHDTDGEKISMYAHYYPLFFGGVTSDLKPGIEIQGRWQNPNILADDHGSLSRAFNPDGTVNRGRNPNQPYPGDITSVTLVPGPYAEFEAACKTTH